MLPSCVPSPQALAEALKTNGSVTSIDLFVNSIGDEGAKARSATECSEVKSPQAFNAKSPRPGPEPKSPSPEHFFADPANATPFV